MAQGTVLKRRVRAHFTLQKGAEETSRGNLIERSKPRCVQFASINVSSLALWEHRFKTETMKGVRRVSRWREEKKERGGEERDRGKGRSGRRCNQFRTRGVTSRLLE